MKPAIAYGLHGSWRSVDIIEITKKDNFYYYGREMNGSQTRGRLSDITADFKTMEMAESAVRAIEATKQNTQPPIDAARKALHDAEVIQRQAINEVIETYKETEAYNDGQTTI